MVQEVRSDPRIAALERRVKDLERLLTLGLVGSDLEELRSEVLQQRAVLGSLVGDSAIGGALLGAFPNIASSQTLRRADGDYHRGASLANVDADVNLTFADGVLWAIPLYAPGRPTLIDRIAIRIETPTTAADVRLGLYQDDGNMYPGQLIVDAGEVSAGSLDLKTLTVNETVPRGVLWLALKPEGANANLAGINASSPGAWVSLGEDPLVDSKSFFISWKKSSQGAGVLPTIFPSGAVKRETAPVMWVSFKAGGWS